jgi:tetratricopeptide (TPR) repeat protein
MKTTTLDADEYFHLALHASSVSDPHACIAYLEEVLQRQPANARALYLRAVQYSELGLTERALSGIREALAIDPALEIARFHLGLLLLFEGDRAKEAMEYLHELGSSSNDDLRRYSQALEALVDDQFPPAREKLALGLAMLSNFESLATPLKRSAP